MAKLAAALVTGPGGELGRAVALALAARGCAVAALDIDGPAAEATAAYCMRNTKVFESFPPRCRCIMPRC